MSLTAIIGVIVCLRYNIAIPLPESQEAALRIAYISLISTIFVTVLCTIIIIKYAQIIGSALNLKEHTQVLYFLPLSTFFLGVFSTLELWSVRKNKFGNIGKARLHQVISSLATQLASFPLGPMGLVFGQLANQSVGCLRLKKQITDDGLTFPIPSQDLLNTAKRYKYFPLLSTWAALLNRTSAQLPTILFAVFFGPVTAGLYALSMRVINAPSGMLSNALGSVFISSASDALSSGNLSTLTTQTHKSLCTLLMPFFIFLSVVSPDMFELFFGEEWRESGQYAQWLAIVVYFSVTVAPLMVLFSVLEKQLHELYFQLGFFLSRCGALYIGWLQDSPYLAVKLYCIVSVFFQMLFLLWVSFNVALTKQSLFKPILSTLCISLLYSAPAIIGTFFFEGVEKISCIALSLMALTHRTFTNYGKI